ncbi:T9SS type A sorting domain-containing protein [Pinibacter aurantiacus]|uniref:T9SS type A sorting domain-containing protein n=1 Tax=Pinibacter aurantiacus TaxID=2851599 RepID=A0A9E2SBJ9_9BACT|nr:T9SS type A sorting domain-containing protein [Pinibacter aurantiacus]MBV4357410.1 T9SS type A sorting domain-containing protein [Pinibacter aurantiacus]
MKYLLTFIIAAFCAVNGYAQVEPLPVPPADSAITTNPELILSAPLLKDNNTVILQWQPQLNGKETSFYTIERSSNGLTFETVAIKKSVAKQDYYEFTDESPLTGSNYYRIKYVVADTARYSSIQSINVKGIFACKFYPNPVDNLLIVKSDKNIMLYITDMNSKIRITKSIAQGIQFVDVSNLEKGYYIITLIQKDDNKWITDKLIKN